MGNEAGFALVMTLAVTALMVAAAAEMVRQVYVDTALSRGFCDGQQASILAESGATGGAALLQTALSGRSYTSLAERWTSPLKLDDENGSLTITVSEESGKLNLNSLMQPNGELEPFTHAALKRLGERLKLPADLWASAADWLDSDDQQRSGGAESSYYRTRRPAYAARNGRMLTLAELSLVKDAAPETVARLRPFVTIYTDVAGSPVATVNINTAPKEVLSALDERIDDRMAERIMEERRLQPFKGTAELSRVPGLDTVAIGLVGKISVKGSLFRIVAHARVKDAGRTVEAVVRLSGGTPEYLSWQEY